MERVLELLKKYGYNVYSFETLEPGLEYWFNEDQSACVAYVSSGGYRVAAGAPICAPERAREIADQFAHELGPVAFFGVSDPFVECIKDGAWDFLQVGQQPAWDPRHWAGVLKSSSDLRRRLRRAEKAGVRVREAKPNEMAQRMPTRRAVDGLVRDWETAHAMPPMRFMVTLDLFSHAHERRYFLAEDESGLVGLMVGVPIYQRRGWLLDDLLVLRGSAPGASEALIDLAMRTFAAENVEYVSLGMVALSGLGEARRSRFPHPILDRVFNFCLRSMSWLYSFHGIHAFRSKFKPDRWEPVYLVGSGRVHVLTMRAVLMAFSGGWLPRFVARVAARQLGPRLKQAEPYLFPGLSLGMAGWSGVLLAHAPLFGGPGLALGWAAFDWAQAAVLWRPERARQAAGLALLDGAATLVQYALRPPRPRGLMQHAVVGAALAGPFALAGLLWLYSESTENQKEPG